ncbi:hypothetical protein BaRGS_00020207 [Batillaria attramentaria]|uniref:Uncharacterized protein n=1 Tax=Batillaria attramentaria TaxID=370345 RepID=A0ABD0KP69_9CAEN
MPDDAPRYLTKLDDASRYLKIFDDIPRHLTIPDDTPRYMLIFDDTSRYLTTVGNVGESVKRRKRAEGLYGTCVLIGHRDLLAQTQTVCVCVFEGAAPVFPA